MGVSWVSNSTLIYTSKLILCSTIWFHSATRHNIHIATLLGTTCCALLVALLQRVATCWVLKSELVRMPGCNIVAGIWPNDYNIMQHIQKCCMKNLTSNKVAKRTQHCCAQQCYDIYGQKPITRSLQLP